MTEVNILLNMSDERIEPSAKKCLLVLGDNESGKEEVISSFPGLVKFRSACPGLKYSYLRISDANINHRIENADQLHLGVWILDQELPYEQLIRHVVIGAPTSFEEIGAVLIVTSLSSPWNVMDSLERAVMLLKTRGCQLDREMPNYNGSVAVFVLLTKSDVIQTTKVADCEHFTEQHWTFIEYHVRKFCLKYGATLFFTSSVEENSNSEMLYNNILCELFNRPFKQLPIQSDREQLFIPAGWDSLDKLSALSKDLAGLTEDVLFNSFICRTLQAKQTPMHLELVEAVDDQEFLRMLQTLMEDRPDQSPFEQPQSQQKIRTSSTLSNFFNNLLGPRLSAATSSSSDSDNGSIAGESAQADPGQHNIYY